jgi:hypothetical protein
MPRGYRCIVLAVVGLLTLAASPTRPESKNEQAQASQPVAASFPDGALTPQRVDESGGEARPCRKGEDDRSSSLCADWKAADAAADSVLWAERTFYLGLGGLVIGLLTLGAATAAAAYARRAAVQTERGARAAEDAVAETRRIGEAQTRCYVKIGSASVEMTRAGVFTINIAVMNSGQSPALEFRWAFRVSCHADGVFWKSKRSSINRALEAATFAAGESYQLCNVNADLFDNLPDRNALVDAAARDIQVSVTMEWQDVFGITHNAKSYFSAHSVKKFEYPNVLEPWRALKAEPDESE